MVKKVNKLVFKDETEFKLALAKAVANMDKKDSLGDYMKTINSLVPLMYQIAIMSAVNEVFLKTYKDKIKDKIK